MILVREMIAVLIGGAIGSVSRFLLSSFINEILPKNFPWGILFVNIIGSLAIGILSGALVGRFALSAAWRAGIFIGFLGGFTTFSSFSLDTVSLMQTQAYGTATINVVASLFFSLAATAVGLLIGRALIS